MGRREAAIDPADGPVQRLAHDLRELRRTAGSPSYRSMAAAAHYAATTLSVAAAGQTMPSLPVTLAYVRACGGDVDEWRVRWQAAQEEPAGPPAPLTVTAPVPVPVPATRPGPATAVWLAVAAALVLVVVAAVAGWHRSPAPAAAAPAPAPTGDPLVNVTVGADCPAGSGTATAATVAVGTSTVSPWSVGTVGGWTGDHCFGEYYFAAGNVDTTVDWTLTGLPATPMDCLISIFVPDSAHANAPAAYELTDQTDALGTTTVDQARHHGDWVGTRPFSVSGGWLRLRLRSAGSAAQQVTAGPIHVYCVRPGHLPR